MKPAKLTSFPTVASYSKLVGIRFLQLYFDIVNMRNIHCWISSKTV